MDPVVHFEIPTDDLARATEFYASVFGWEIHETPFEDGVYTSVVTSPVDEEHMHEERGAINGAIIDRDADLTAPLITINVPSIDEYVPEIEATGGSLLVGKGEIPDMGYYAYFEDPDGNVVGLWETMAQD